MCDWIDELNEVKTDNKKEDAIKKLIISTLSFLTYSIKELSEGSKRPMDNFAELFNLVMEEEKIKQLEEEIIKERFETLLSDSNVTIV